ncbi:MAG TPA: type II toxin-antitoxin system VapC family toxin [Verrucomicrobiae bacterium]
MIVADANLITCLVIPNEFSEAAAAVFEADPVWVAPLLWRSEFRGALADCLVRQGMTLDAGLLAMRSAEDIIAGREYRVESAAVLELVKRSKCSAYDCEYVALAKDLSVPLVTFDRALSKAFPKVVVAVEKFVRKQ